MGTVTRSRGTYPVPPCVCGREFTTLGGRSNHARTCPPVWARNAVQLAHVKATIERARAARTDP